MTTPLSVYLPFNREVLGADFQPAKHGGPPPEQRGRWLLVQVGVILHRPLGRTALIEDRHDGAIGTPS